MHVPQLLHSLLRSPNVEVIETCLPERSLCRFLREQVALPRVASFSLRQQRMRRALLQDLHDRRRAPHLGFGDQQMHMLWHDYVADNYKAIAQARLLQNR